MLTTIYFSGVLFIFAVFIVYLFDKKKLTLTDLIQLLFYMALSWTTVLFVLSNGIVDWIEKKKKNKILFKFKDNYNN